MIYCLILLRVWNVSFPDKLYPENTFHLYGREAFLDNLPLLTLGNSREKIGWVCKGRGFGKNLSFCASGASFTERPLILVSFQS